MIQGLLKVFRRAREHSKQVDRATELEKQSRSFWTMVGHSQERIRQESKSRNMFQQYREIWPALRKMIEREHVKESTMGSYEAVKKIASCYHQWIPLPVILLGYMRVDAQCAKCKTWWAPNLLENHEAVAELQVL